MRRSARIAMKRTTSRIPNSGVLKAGKGAMRLYTNLSEPRAQPGKLPERGPVRGAPPCRRRDYYCTLAQLRSLPRQPNSSPSRQASIYRDDVYWLSLVT